MPSSRRSRRRPYGDSHPDLDVEAALRGLPRTEGRADGSSWSVRSVAGSEKTYRCPGCDQAIVPGTAHVVVWANDHLLGADSALAERRHWHSACWKARDTRGPTRR
jgi:hypothetical protein